MDVAYHGARDWQQHTTHQHDTTVLPVRHVTSSGQQYQGQRSTTHPHERRYTQQRRNAPHLCNVERLPVELNGAQALTLDATIDVLPDLKRRKKQHSRKKSDDVWAVAEQQRFVASGFSEKAVQAIVRGNVLASNLRKLCRIEFHAS